MEIIVQYLEILVPSAEPGPLGVAVTETLRPCEVSNKAEAQAEWDARKADHPGATAQWHYHHHGDTAEPCIVEATLASVSSSPMCASV